MLVTSGLAYIVTSPTTALVLRRLASPSPWVCMCIICYVIQMTCDKLQVHISGLATLQLGYTVFGPVPPLEPLASLALTTLGLGLQGVGLSMSYLGGR